MRSLLFVLLLSASCLLAQPRVTPSRSAPSSGPGSGTVTSIATSCGITGGTITATGTIKDSIATDSQTGAGAFPIPSGDCGKLIARNQASAVSDTIAQAGVSFPAGWYVLYQCIGAGGCTVTPTTSTINGSSSLTLTQGQGVNIVSDGTNYFAQGSVVAGGATGNAGGDLSGTYPNPTVAVVSNATKPTTGNVAAFDFNNITTIVHDLLFTDATYDIGKSGATRPRDIFGSRNAFFGGTLGATGHVTFEGVTSTGATGTGNLVFGASPALTGTPTVPTATPTSQDTTAASTAFVQGLLSTFNPAISVAAATTAVLSNTPTYSNGTAGVGATLTASSNGALTIDGYTVLLNDQVLVNNQASGFQNGVYDLTTLGDGSTHYVLTRDTTFNTAANINGSGAIPVLNGTVNNNTLAILNSAVATIGTDSITYTLIPNTSVSNAKTPHSVTFNLNGNGSTIATGATNQYVETEVASTSGIYKVVTTGTATSGPANCSITVDVWKRNAAIPSSSQKISASAPATLSTAQYSVNTTNTGWTKNVNTGDVWSASVASVTGCVSATVQVWWK